MLISRDGVPIASINLQTKSSEGDDRDWVDSAEDSSAFAGMVAGWLSEIRRSIDPLSWDAPKRVVLRAARGTLVLLITERVTITVELDRGMAPEELRLPMEATAARLERVLRREASTGVTPEVKPSTEEPSGIFPGQSNLRTEGTESSEQQGNVVPETTRDN